MTLLERIELLIIRGLVRLAQFVFVPASIVAGTCLFFVMAFAEKSETGR